MANTSHYMIEASDWNSDSLTLVVEATSVEEAEKLWRNWVEKEMEGEADGQVTIFQLPPLQGTPRICPWHEQSGVVIVKEFKA